MCDNLFKCYVKNAIFCKKSQKSCSGYELCLPASYPQLPKLPTITDFAYCGSAAQLKQL